MTRAPMRDWFATHPLTVCWITVMGGLAIYLRVSGAGN